MPLAVALKATVGRTLISSRQRRLKIKTPMANTYSQLFYHLVFSTKGRLNLIEQEIEDRVWSYIGGVARKHNLTSMQVGGIEDHIHALVMARPVVAPCQIPPMDKRRLIKMDPY